MEKLSGRTTLATTQARRAAAAARKLEDTVAPVTALIVQAGKFADFIEEHATKLVTDELLAVKASDSAEADSALMTIVDRRHGLMIKIVTERIECEAEYIEV